MADDRVRETPAGYYVYKTPTGAFLACVHPRPDPDVAPTRTYGYDSYDEAVDACERFENERARGVAVCGAFTYEHRDDPSVFASLEDDPSRPE